MRPTKDFCFCRFLNYFFDTLDYEPVQQFCEVRRLCSSASNAGLKASGHCITTISFLQADLAACARTKVIFSPDGWAP